MSIKIFYGSDRVKARETVSRFLGEKFEIIEGEQIDIGDLDSIFYGVSIFDSTGDGRKILIKDLARQKACMERLPLYADTNFSVILLEDKLDKRSFKAIFDCKEIETREFVAREEATRDKFENFKPFERAFAGCGADALRLLRKLEMRSAPLLLLGTMGSQASKLMGDKDAKKAAKAVKAMKILAKADLMSKGSGIGEWVPVEWALLEIANL